MDTATASLFAPYTDLAKTLLRDGVGSADDGSHDVAHLARVWANVRVIQQVEGGDLRCLAAATLLHDCVAVEKNAPDRAQASSLAAEKAQGILGNLDWAAKDVALISHAIAAHSFSANIPPKTIEAKILQDADRLDAIGWVGVARCFYVAGRMGSRLYDPADPGANDRPLDDTKFALDHFETKLLTLASGFQTATGAALAKDRHANLKLFVSGLMDEISPQG